MQRRMNRDVMRQARQLQERIAKAQEEIENSTVEVSAGGGAVTVVMSGKPKVHSITIAPEVIDKEDPEMLQDIIVAAVNEALDKAASLQHEKLGALSGLGLPGLS